MTKFYGKKLQTQYWCFFMGHSVCYYVRITVSPAITLSLGIFRFLSSLPPISFCNDLFYGFWLHHPNTRPLCLLAGVRCSCTQLLENLVTTKKLTTTVKFKSIWCYTIHQMSPVTLMKTIFRQLSARSKNIGKFWLQGFDTNTCLKNRCNCNSFLADFGVTFSSFVNIFSTVTGFSCYLLNTQMQWGISAVAGMQMQMPPAAAPLAKFCIEMGKDSRTSCIIYCWLEHQMFWAVDQICPTMCSYLHNPLT